MLKWSSTNINYVDKVVNFLVISDKHPNYQKEINEVLKKFNKHNLLYYRAELPATEINNNFIRRSSFSFSFVETIRNIPESHITILDTPRSLFIPCTSSVINYIENTQQISCKLFHKKEIKLSLEQCMVCQYKIECLTKGVPHFLANGCNYNYARTDQIPIAIINTLGVPPYGPYK